MGLFKNIKTGRQLAKRNISLDQLDQWMEQQVTGGRKSFTGVDISAETALNYSAKWNSTAILAQTLASLPLIIYKRTGETSKKRFPKHPLYDILHNQPNSEMNSFIWRETAMVHLVTWGNHYSWIEFEGQGWNIKGLWPLEPSRTRMKRSDNGRIVYQYRKPNGEEIIYPDWKIFHVPGMGFNGRSGYNIINKSRQSLGLGLATEEYGSRWFGTGSHPGGILEHPGRLSDNAQDNLKKNWKAVHGGLTGAHDLGVLEEGMKYHEISTKPEEAQALETRKFQVTEEARWSGLPPHKLKDLERATFSNIEEQQIEFVMDSMRLWVTRWEQCINMQLLRADERETIFSEFLMEGLLRGDIEKRYNAYAVSRQNGWMNADEIRSRENLNPIKGGSGKIYWMPLNMTDASKAGDMSFMKSEDKVEEEGQEEEKSIWQTLEQRGVGLRSMRSLQWRRRTADAYKQPFRDATKRILAVERKNVEKFAKKGFGERTIVNFNNDIDEWYLSDKTKDFVRKEFAGVYKSYADEIHKIASQEINSIEKPDEAFGAEIDKYIEHTSNRYIMSSRGQLKSEARKAEETETDSIEAINKRLDEWDEKRPDKVANREVVDGESGIASYVYFAGGFRTRWVTIGKNCPYCDSLEGMIIDRGGAFLMAGTAWEPIGANHGPISITSNVGHPGAHGGCDCSVMATL